MNSLRNKTILITKSELESKKNLDALKHEGAELLFCPTIKIVPAINSPELDDALRMFNQFDYLVFTSANAVEVFFDIAAKRKLNLSKAKVAVVGKSTADECESVGIRVDIIPDEFSSKGLIDKLSEFDLINKKIFIPGSSLSGGDLNLGLSELGAQVYSVPVYDVVPNDLNNLKNEHKKIQKKHPNVFIFTSPSSFNNFLRIMSVTDSDKYFGTSTICAIGATTESAIREKGLAVHIVPKTFSLQGVSEAIIKYFQITADIA
ncbi:MAG: uroporphyrinogen-III synthase [Ignavibacteriales bacterium]|nr:uroporphyrinogen-III synthase [Ignavibacteriales bacterium]